MIELATVLAPRLGQVAEGGRGNSDWPVAALIMGVAGAVALVVGLLVVGWVSQRRPERRPPPRDGRSPGG